MAHGDETCYSCAAEETEKPGLRSFDVETWTAIGHSLKAEELLRFGMAVGRTLVLDRTMPNRYTIVEHIADRRLDETESDLLHLSGSPLARLRTLELLCAHDPASHGPGATNAQRLAARIPRFYGEGGHRGRRRRPQPAHAPHPAARRARRARPPVPQHALLHGVEVLPVQVVAEREAGAAQQGGESVPWLA